MLGFIISLCDVLVQMIIVSDNVCMVMVMECISLEEINQFCCFIGMCNMVYCNLVLCLDMLVDYKFDEVIIISVCDQGLLYDLIFKGCFDYEVVQCLGCML